MTGTPHDAPSQPPNADDRPRVPQAPAAPVPEPSLAGSTRAAEALPPTEDLGRDFGSHLRREPGLILTVVSLSAAALGLWASYWYYRPFGIQIIDYMQIGDFLIGWLRDPTYIGLTLLAVALGWAMTWHDRFTRYHADRARALRSRWWGRMLFPEKDLQPRRFDPLGPVTGMLFAIVTGALVLLYWYASVQAEHIRDGRGEHVQLVRAGHVEADAQAPILLGVVNEWVFVYWPEQHRAEAIPQLAVSRIVYPDQTPTRSAAPVASQVH